MHIENEIQALSASSASPACASSYQKNSAGPPGVDRQHRAVCGCLAGWLNARPGMPPLQAWIFWQKVPMSDMPRTGHSRRPANERSAQYSGNGGQSPSFSSRNRDLTPIACAGGAHLPRQVNNQEKVPPAQVQHAPAAPDSIAKPSVFCKRASDRPRQKCTSSASTAAAAHRRPSYLMPSSSTSKFSVALGGITPPAPRAP